MRLPLDGRAISYDLLVPAAVPPDAAPPDAAPVVCLSHALAADGGQWAEQVEPLLQAGFRVLRLDMRGHGGSDPVAGPYTMDALADDIAVVLDALGIQRVHAIGLSIGGMLGQAFALRHGAKLISALWCGTLPCAAPGTAEAWHARTAIVQQHHAVAPLADATMERWLTDAFKARNPGRWQQIRATIAATTPAGYLGCGAALGDFDFTAQLPSLRLPVLVACGADDTGTPPSENRRIAALVPGARYAEIPAARHLATIEQPEAFNRIMLAWLQSQRDRP